jgi:hypothetical protein
MRPGVYSITWPRLSNIDIFVSSCHYQRKWEKGSLVMNNSRVVDRSHIKQRDTLVVFIAEMKLASTSLREAQKALASASLDVCCGYQDISTQIYYALSQSEAALEGARHKLKELEPQIRQ